MFKNFISSLIQLYRWTLSPLLGNVCRFHPSCSSYAHICIERFGLKKGLGLSVKRLCRCHPFNPGGFDPAPSLNSNPPQFKAKENV